MSYPKAWTKIGHIFNDYSTYIIKRYPKEYFNRFILWNTKKSFKTFAIDENDNFIFTKEAKDLYGFEQNESYEYKYRFFRAITPVRKIANAVLWGLVFLGIAFWIWKFRNFSRLTNQVLILLALWVILYTAGSVVAHPVNNFRYVLPILAPRLIFCTIIAIHLVLFRRKNARE